MIHPGLAAGGLKTKSLDGQGVALGLAEFLRSVGEAGTSLDLRRLLKAALAHEGYETFQLLRFHRRQLSAVIWSELPHGLAGWRATEAWGPCLPLLMSVLESGAPLVWPAGGERAQRTPDQLSLLRMAADCGAKDGVVIPVPGAGPNADVLIAGRCRLPCGAELDEPRTWTLAAIAFVVCSRLRQIDRGLRRDQEECVVLSPREIEVLSWCKDGKSYSEIGMIMGISNKTVEFHIANVMRKLGVHQKISAIVAAAKHGLIEL